MADLRRALAAHPQHRLLDEVAPLADTIQARWAAWVKRWGPPGALPRRICHGDLKVSNIRFADDALRGICMIDLVGLMHASA